MFNKVSSISKMLEKFYKSCNYNKFIVKYNFYMNSEISDDVKNYLRILNTNFLFLIDQNKAFAEYEKISLPTDNKYLQAFYFLEIVYLTRKGDYTEARSKLNNYKKHNSLSKEDCSSLDVYINIYSDKDVEDIEKIFTLTNKIKYQNVFSAKLLMDYYISKDSKKALEYAKIIKSYKTDFTETNYFAEEIVLAHSK